jgi:hypothetical protein
MLWGWSLQDAGGGALIQLAVDEGKGLGHPGVVLGCSWSNPIPSKRSVCA